MEISSLPSAFASGVQGLQRATQRADEASFKIAQAGTTKPEQDVVEPLVELKQAELQASASAKVVETADRVLGSLLDVKA